MISLETIEDQIHNFSPIARISDTKFGRRPNEQFSWVGKIGDHVQHIYSSFTPEFLVDCPITDDGSFDATELAKSAVAKIERKIFTAICKEQVLSVGDDFNAVGAFDNAADVHLRNADLGGKLYLFLNAGSINGIFGFSEIDISAKPYKYNVEVDSRIQLCNRNQLLNAFSGQTIGLIVTSKAIGIGISLFALERANGRHILRIHCCAQPVRAKSITLLNQK